MSSSRFGTRFRKRRLAAAACVAAAVTAAAACSSGGGSSSSGNAASGSNSSTGTVTVAVVSNPLVTGQMIPLTQSVFEKENPGITVKFATYTEGDLRAAIEKDVSTHSNSFNAVMIGPYEAPLFAKNSWLVDLTKQYIASDPSYDASDLLPPVAKALSYNGDLYAAPFYGESSMLYYNKTLLKAAGRHHARSTRPGTQVQAAAAKLNQPGKVSGICLRGLAGWGDNMAALDTVINTFGGEWYNTSWQAQLNSPATTAAINFYVNLVKQYGEPGASNDSFNQLLTLYGQGKCAMWYDATVAATSIATRVPVGLRPDRLRVRADREDLVLRLALVLVPRHPAGRERPERRLEVDLLGHLQAVRHPGRAEVRLVGGAAGQPDLALQQRQLPEGGRAVRQHHAAVHRRHRP